MNFQEAEKTYKEFQAQHNSGRLNDAAFEAEVGKLRMQDEQGRWWQIGVQTGEWYMHDGQKWNKAKPPAPAPVVAAPAPQPQPPSATTDRVSAGAAIPAPKPGKDAKKVEAAPKPKDDTKQPRASAMPRLFSAKPAGREGGLSRPVLIGIIAAAAVVILLLIAGGYFVVNNVLGTASKPTVVPTRSLAVLPSPVLPTVVPTQRPTETLVLPPTPVVTATALITTTAPTATRAPAGPTATKKPAGTPTTAATATPNVPPGVYVTKIETIPGKPSIGNSMGFKITFLNNTGSLQAYKVMVKVYKCPEQCEGDNAYKNSYGETLRADANLTTGAPTFTTSQNINLGIGLSCNLVAIPHYIDPTSQQVVPFPALKGNALYQPIQICQ